MSYVIKCDRCSKAGGQGTQGALPQGWGTVGMNVRRSGGTGYKWHQFCEECVEHLGIKGELVEETSAEKLIAILESMVDNAIEKRDT